MFGPNCRARYFVLVLVLDINENFIIANSVIGHICEVKKNLKHD